MALYFCNSRLNTLTEGIEELNTLTQGIEELNTLTQGIEENQQRLTVCMFITFVIKTWYKYESKQSTDNVTLSVLTAQTLILILQFVFYLF